MVFWALGVRYRRWLYPSCPVRIVVIEALISRGSVHGWCSALGALAYSRTPTGPLQGAETCSDHPDNDLVGSTVPVGLGLPFLTWFLL